MSEATPCEPCHVLMRAPAYADCAQAGAAGGRRSTRVWLWKHARMRQPPGARNPPPRCVALRQAPARPHHSTTHRECEVDKLDISDGRDGTGPQAADRGAVRKIE